MALVIHGLYLFSKAKVPDFKDKSKMLSLDPDVTLKLAKSRDHEELEYYWTQWREVTGKGYFFFGDSH